MPSPPTAQRYHDEVTELFDEYFKRTTSGRPSVEYRNEKSGDMIERYFREFETRPPDSVVSRLATYILLDTLSDPHPDKMSREEYPIMSYGQTGRHFARNGRLSDEPYTQESVTGRRGGVGGEIILDSEIPEQRAEEWRIFLQGELSERESYIVKRMYEDGATQAEIAGELAISCRWVREIHTRILDKMREVMSK